MPDVHLDPRDAAFMAMLDADVSAAMAHTSSTWMGPDDAKFMVALTVSRAGDDWTACLTVTTPDLQVRVVPLTPVALRSEFVGKAV